MSPASDEQRTIKARILQASSDIANTRLLMFADGDNPILTPFLLILIVWLVVIFTSFGLFVEPGRVVVTVLLVFALSVSSALFLIADLSQPYAGLMQISSEPLMKALSRWTDRPGCPDFGVPPCPPDGGLSPEGGG